VIALDRELEDPEAGSRSVRDSALNRGEHGVRTERGEPVLRAQRHMQRVTRTMSRSVPVRDADLPARRLASRTRALPTPAPGTELQLDRFLCHLE